MEIMSSPWKNAPDSPSRQLLYELSRLGVAAQENFYARLDRENREREALHRDALAAAAVAHERIRRNAVLERERLELQLQAERRRRDEEDQRELERRRQEKAELEIAEKRREVERARLAEIAEKRIADARKAEAAAAEKKKQEREAKEAEIARQLKEEQDAKAKTAEAARQAENEAKEVAARTKKAKELAAAFSQPSNPHAIGKSPAIQPNVNPKREAEHQRYLQIHRNLKELRKLLTTRATNFPEVKQHMGEMRREIKKSVGQLTEGKGANRGPVSPSNPPHLP
jgi:nucleoporin GLE1